MSNTVAAIYARISLASMGDTTKTDEQVRQCREVCKMRGWEVGEIFVDNSKSAWKRNRNRPAWTAMLEGAKAGRFDAIATYWSDRLARSMRDLEDLLDLREIRNIKLATVTGGYDFDNPEHRMMMRWEASRAINESDTISRRTKNARARLRRQGLSRAGGPAGRCFGFETDGVTHRDAETAVIRRAAAAILAGQSLGSVTRELAAGGVQTVAAKPMHQNGLRRILTTPRMAALMPDGVSAAAWEPVLDRGDWEIMCAILARNQPLPNAGRGAQHLLSGIALCGVTGCDRTLWAGGSAAGPAYKCFPSGHLSRVITHLDAYVSAAVVDYIRRGPAARMPDTPGLATEYAALTQQRGEIEQLIADHTRGALPALLARIDSIDNRLEELRAAAQDTGRLRLLSEYRNITDDQFAALPLSVRRSLVSACLEVTVLPALRRGGPGFHPEYVELRRR